MKPSSDHRRNRKQHQKQSTIILRQTLLSVRSLLFCFTVLTLLIFLISHIAPFTSSSFHFHPTLVVSSLSLLSSSSSLQDFSNFAFPLKLENWVLFPDHVLLLVKGDIINDLECVYFSKNQLGSQNQNQNLYVQNVLSVDEYSRFKSVVRCPIPVSPEYSSSRVNLRWAGAKNWIFEGLNSSSSSSVNCCSWKNVVYEAVLEGGNVVAVFVKGLNLRADRFSDPRHFSCHFGLGKSSVDGEYTLRTAALTAAQEIVRCPLPHAIIQSNPDKIQGIRVTVGFRRNYHARSQNPVLMPSVANVFDEMAGREKNGKEKHRLCVCTMVRNQASSIREWITYHAWLGVGRWFIYDNNSDDGLKQIIQQLDLENYNVTRHVWPWIKTQEAGFSHCALRARDECDWVSFMDVDEYFYFPYLANRQHRFRNTGYSSQNSLQILVSNISSVSRNVGEIRTYCHSFGPSGLNSPPLQGVTVGYTCRLEGSERHKSIIRPDALDPGLVNVVHHFRLKNGFEYLNLPEDTVTINHYKYQVWEVFREKFYRRVATYVTDWRESHNIGSRDRAPGLGTEAVKPPDWSQRFCEVWDTGLRDFVLTNLVDLSTGLLPWERK